MNAALAMLVEAFVLHRNSMSNPRFRTMHEAGKYLAAQMYPEGRKLEPKDYGAVDRYIENPAWKLAPYEAVIDQLPDHVHIIDHSESEIKEESQRDTDFKFPWGTQMTSAEWYAYYANDYTIIMANGWDDELDGYNFWNHNLIDESEFRARLFSSIIEPT